MNVLIKRLATEYDDLTIEKAYEYLKTLPEFEGAEDILEEKHNLS